MELTRELSVEEKKKYEKPARVTFSDTSSSYSWKYEPPKEKAIKIKVTKGEGSHEKTAEVESLEKTEKNVIAEESKNNENTNVALGVKIIEDDAVITNKGP